MNNAVFDKTMENVRKHPDIKLARKKLKEKLFTCYNQIVTQQTTKWFGKVMINTPVYLGFSIFQLNEIEIFQFWYE